MYLAYHALYSCGSCLSNPHKDVVSLFGVALELKRISSWKDTSKSHKGTDTPELIMTVWKQKGQAEICIDHSSSKATVVQFSSAQLLSRVWLFVTPWIEAFQASPVHHQLPEFTQTHVHRVRDAIQPSHPGSSPSTLAPNPSQHQSLFQWVNSSHEVAKVLEFQL